MTIRAYFLLSDPDETDENQDIGEQAYELEQSTGLDIVDYMYIDDEVQRKPYIEYEWFHTTYYLKYIVKPEYLR